MKRITIILLLTSTLGFSQNLEFKPTNDDFSTEFIRLVNSTRTSMYGTRTKTHMNPQWKSAKYRKSRKAVKWITNSYEFNTQIDSNASSACEHHNRYMYYLVIGEDYNPIVIDHTENIVALGYKYKGSDTLLYDWKDRCDYYCGVDNFSTHGECIWGGHTDHSRFKDMTSTELARETYNRFMNSKKGHRDILINDGYTDCGIRLTIDPEFKCFRITFVTGTKKAKS